MAQLKDLIVNGASRLIGKVYTSDIQISSIDAPTSAGGNTYGPGTNGQILKSNGSSVYWDSSVTPASHLHGNLTNAGTITATAALANGDHLIFADSSDSNKIKSTSISFDGSSTQSALSRNGDWVNYLEIAGGTMTGAIALKGLYGTENIDYGDTLPSTATEGQIFFQIADDIGFALPPGGTAGNALIKNSNDDGDVIWGEINALPNGGTAGYALIKNSNSDNDVTWANVSYTLPQATSNTLGGITVGSGLSVSNGNISVNWSNAPVTSVAGKTGAVSLSDLTIGNKTYNGTTAIIVNTVDLGLASPMTFKGVTNTTLSDGATTTPVNIVSGGTTGPLSPANGNVVLQKTSQLEYVYSNGAWHQLGLASSYALANHNHDSTYVAKAGDTMTGGLILKHTGIAIGDTPSSQQSISLSVVDQNNTGIGFTGGGIDASGQVFQQIGAQREINGSTMWHHVRMSINSSGTATVSLGQPNAWRTALNVVNKAGDTMTGNLLGSKTNTIGSTADGNHWYKLYIGGSTSSSNAIDSANPLIEFSNSGRSQYGQLVYTDYDAVRAPDGLTWVGNQANSWFQAPRVFGAVWNDYAEYRETKEEIQPGRCIVETGKGDLILSTERLQAGCEIVSDTFGFAIGETNKCKTPTACAGRVLAYLYEDNSLAKPGDPVCSGPNGTISIMTHEEEKEWPSRIIGTISEIPTYEEWEYGSADVHGNKKKLKVDGRIWIRIR